MSGGVVGIDRSGSEADLPIVIGAVYSKNYGKFNSVYQLIKELVVDWKPIFSFRREIKPKHIKPLDLKLKILKLIQENFICLALLVDKENYFEIKDRIKNLKKWRHKLEAILWYIAFDSLVKKTGELPNQIICDYAFVNRNDQALFEDWFNNLVKRDHRKLKLRSVDSYFADPVKISDLLAGFIRSGIRNDFTGLIERVNKKKVIHLVPGMTSNPGRSNDKKDELLFKVYGIEQDFNPNYVWGDLWITIK